MPSVTIEIGLRGRETDVAKFVEEMKADEEASWWSGGNREPHDSSLSRYTYDSNENIMAEVERLIRDWSQRFPESEAYAYRETSRHQRTGDQTKVEYAVYKAGKMAHEFVIDTHEKWESHFGTEGRECSCTRSMARRNPLSTPFDDCPPRLNPPREWAIENIMTANEYIGRR